MKGFYYVVDSLKTELDSSPFVNTVTEGSLENIDLAKQTIYPLAHIVVNSMLPEQRSIVWNVTVFNLDIVDYSKTLTTDIFKGNNNRQDILNEQSIVVARFIQSMRYGDFSDLNIDLISVSPSVEINERFENVLAGWETTFEIAIPNEMSVC